MTPFLLSMKLSARRKTIPSEAGRPDVTRAIALRAVAQLWHEARGQRRMPSWADLPPHVLSPYFKQLWGYQYDSKTEEFTGRLAGNRLSKWVGPTFSGVRLQDFVPCSSYEASKQHLTKIVTTPLAGRSSGRLFTVSDFAVTGERIALPLATDGKTGEGVLGASDYAPPPMLGPVEYVHENVEWYAI